MPFYAGTTICSLRAVVPQLSPAPRIIPFCHRFSSGVVVPPLLLGSSAFAILNAPRSSGDFPRISFQADSRTCTILSAHSRLKNWLFFVGNLIPERSSSLSLSLTTFFLPSLLGALFAFLSKRWGSGAFARRLAWTFFESGLLFVFSPGLRFLSLFFRTSLFSSFLRSVPAAGVSLLDVRSTFFADRSCCYRC